MTLGKKIQNGGKKEDVADKIVRDCTGAVFNALYPDIIKFVSQYFMYILTQKIEKAIEENNKTYDDQIQLVMDDPFSSKNTNFDYVTSFESISNFASINFPSLRQSILDMLAADAAYQKVISDSEDSTLISFHQKDDYKVYSCLKPYMFSFDLIRNDVTKDMINGVTELLKEQDLELLRLESFAHQILISVRPIKLAESC
jgi:hypothetical protein